MQDHELVPRISAEEIERGVAEVAARINRDYAGKSIVAVGILKGAFVFMADLVRRLTVPVEIDFVRLASYGDQCETCGAIRLTKGLEVNVEGRHVLVVEDIVDTGTTLSWFIRHLDHHRPASVRLCALIDKAERRSVPLSVDYAAIQLSEGFVVGYGLDYSERYRNLPGIHEVRFTEKPGGA